MSLLPSVFVSYARTDSHSIQYAVGLLEAGGAEVFRDIDDIGFGERWEEVITDRIKDCERVLVFWSKASQQSEWVGREYKMALKLGKKLVPVMLDNTPLPPDLGAFHALTLSHFTPKTSRLKRYGGWVLGGVATTALAGVLGLEFFRDESVEMQSMAVSPTEESVELAAAAETINGDAASADTQTFEQSAEIMLEAQQAMEQSTQGLDTESEAVGNNSADVDSASAITGAAQENTAGVVARQDNAVAFNQQSMRAPAAAVKTPEISKIPAPAAPARIVVEPELSVESSAASEVVSDSEAAEVSGAAPTAEGRQLSQLLPWIIGFLALLALCWLAVRRYTQRDQAAGERFVEMVFDEPSQDTFKKQNVRTAVTDNH